MSITGVRIGNPASKLVYKCTFEKAESISVDNTTFKINLHCTPKRTELLLRYPFHGQHLPGLRSAKDGNGEKLMLNKLVFHVNSALHAPLTLILSPCSDSKVAIFTINALRHITQAQSTLSTYLQFQVRGLVQCYSFPLINALHSQCILAPLVPA